MEVTSGTSVDTKARRESPENALPALKSQDFSGNRGAIDPAKTPQDLIVLETRARLSAALHEAGSSALGMPCSIDTFLPWLKQHGLALVPLKTGHEAKASKSDPCPHDHETHRFADDGGRI